MSEEKAVEMPKPGRITIRPFQFEYTVICLVERDGIIDTAKAEHRIMEVNFNGTTLQGMIAAATKALEDKYNSGG